MSSKEMSPSGLGLGSYQHTTRTTAPKARPEPKDKAKAKTKGKELTSGTLNGIQWADIESRKVLYEFARDEGLDVFSRDSKAQIVSALSAATKAQG